MQRGLQKARWGLTCTCGLCHDGFMQGCESHLIDELGALKGYRPFYANKLAVFRVGGDWPSYNHKGLDLQLPQH